METITVGLIAGRHEMPVERYIFEGPIEDPTDFKFLNNHIMDWLLTNVGIKKEFDRGLNSATYEDEFCYVGQRNLSVYVTGLTQAAVALVSCCAFNGIILDMYHYDPSDGTYKRQRVI